MTKLRIFCPKCDHEFFYRGLMHWIRDSSDRRAACGVSIRSLNVSTDPKKARCSKCKEKAEYAGLKATQAAATDETKSEGVRDGSAYVPEGGCR